MKKRIIPTSILTLFVAVLAAEDISTITWTEITASNAVNIVPNDNTSYKVTGTKWSKNNTTAYAYSIDAKNADNLWVASGTVLNTPPTGPLYMLKSEKNVHIQGAKYLTILGDPDVSTGPYFTGAFKGNMLQADKDSYVYIYGGNYYNKVSAISTGSVSAKYTGTTLQTTGHMFIYGGSFNNSVTGLGMASEGNYTFNSDIQILGKITASEGVFGGISGDSSGSADLYGNTKVTISGDGYISGQVVAGNRMASNITGNTTVSVVDNGTVSGIMGGNYFENSQTGKSNIDGNVNVIVEGGIIGDDKSIGGTGLTGFSGKGIVGGGVNTSISGKVKIDISENSTITGGIIAGSMGWDSTSINTTELNISGGEINATTNNSMKLANQAVANQIYAGSVAIGTSTYGTAEVSITNGTLINVTGGSINSDIFGGGYSVGTETYSAVTTVNGGVKINVDVQNDITIDGDIYAGGNQGDNGKSVVNGGAVVTFKNTDGKVLTFDGVVSGSGLNGASVNGAKVFAFEQYVGEFNGSIRDFDLLEIGSTQITNAIAVENISNVSVSTGSSVAFANAIDIETLTVDFSEDKFNVNTQISLAEGSTIEEIVLVEFASYSLDLSEIFGDSVGVVLSSLDSNETSFALVDNQGNKTQISDYTIDGTNIYFHVIPEPSTYAAIFGALALAFAAYRRRK